MGSQRGTTVSYETQKGVRLQRAPKGALPPRGGHSQLEQMEVRNDCNPREGTLQTRRVRGSNSTCALCSMLFGAILLQYMFRTLQPFGTGPSNLHVLLLNGNS